MSCLRFRIDISIVLCVCVVSQYKIHNGEINAGVGSIYVHCTDSK